MVGFWDLSGRLTGEVSNILSKFGKEAIYFFSF